MVLGDILVPNAPKKLPENETLRFRQPENQKNS